VRGLLIYCADYMTYVKLTEAGAMLFA